MKYSRCIFCAKTGYTEKRYFISEFDGIKIYGSGDVHPGCKENKLSNDTKKEISKEEFDRYIELSKIL